MRCRLRRTCRRGVGKRRGVRLMRGGMNTGSVGSEETTLGDHDSENQRPHQAAHSGAEHQTTLAEGKGLGGHRMCLLEKLRDPLQMFQSHSRIVRAEALQRPIPGRLRQNLHLGRLRKQLLGQMICQTDQNRRKVPLARSRFHEFLQLMAQLGHHLGLSFHQFRTPRGEHQPAHTFIKLPDQTLVLKYLPEHLLLPIDFAYGPFGVQPGHEMGNHNGHEHRGQGPRNPTSFLFLQNQSITPLQFTSFSTRPDWNRFAHSPSKWPRHTTSAPFLSGECPPK